MKKQTIQVLGSGCPNCKQLFETVEKIAQELKIETKVEYITDVSKMIKMGVMTSPVLAINEKPVLTGKGHSDDEIKKAIIDNLSQEEEKNNDDNCCCDCSCKCDC